MSGARHSSRNATKDDQRPSILQLNTEGLTANKMNVIEQLAYKEQSICHRLTRDPVQLHNCIVYKLLQ